MSSTRPVNHPQRRLAALAMLVHKWPAFRRTVASPITVGEAVGFPNPDANSVPYSGKKVRMRGLLDFLGALDHPFWKFHYTLTSEASPKAMALIGESRIADILANVLFPFWLAEDADPSTPLGTSIWQEYTKLPARLSNRRLETAATRLFGNDSRRKQFLKTITHQQGLLQIDEDFCMQDNSDCAQCPFPEQMRKWK
jgi:hypothetical protein